MNIEWPYRGQLFHDTIIYTYKIMSEPIYTNRPKEDEPTYFNDMSEEELERHLATIDMEGLRQLHLEMYGPYSEPVTTKEEARKAILGWCCVRVLERDGLLKPVTDDQGNQVYRRGQRVFQISPLVQRFIDFQS